jgi:hypothetical protein
MVKVNLGIALEKARMKYRLEQYSKTKKKGE